MTSFQDRSHPHVLHICGDYPYTPLYRELLSHLAEWKKFVHTMYVPLSSRAVFSDHYDLPLDNVNLLYSRDFRWFERMLYHRKVRKTVAAIQRQVPVESLSLVHAHYLFSAGGVAYALKKAANLKYVVAVRNTDLNIFFPIALHLRRFGLKVLEGAARVIFISPAYQNALLRRYVPERLHKSILAKAVVLPNGISDFWFDHRLRRPSRVNDGTVRLLFVGEFTKNRNLPGTIKVARLLRERGYRVHLSIVGAGPEAHHIRKLAAGQPGLVSIHDWADKEQLLAFYKQADVFLMPSFHDTFGLVYIEAMSQGVPVIYTRGEGIDGYFPNGKIGYACDPHDLTGITERIIDILRDYDRMSASATQSIDQFSWRQLSAQYEEMYRSLCP